MNLRRRGAKILRTKLKQARKKKNRLRHLKMMGEQLNILFRDKVQTAKSKWSYRSRRPRVPYISKAKLKERRAI